MSDQVLRTAITGRPRYSSASYPSWRMRALCDQVRSWPSVPYH